MTQLRVNNPLPRFLLVEEVIREIVDVSVGLISFGEKFLPFDAFVRFVAERFDPQLREDVADTVEVLLDHRTSWGLVESTLWSTVAPHLPEDEATQIDVVPLTTPFMGRFELLLSGDQIRPRLVSAA